MYIIKHFLMNLKITDIEKIYSVVSLYFLTSTLFSRWEELLSSLKNAYKTFQRPANIHSTPTLKVMELLVLNS